VVPCVHCAFPQAGILSFQETASLWVQNVGDGRLVVWIGLQFTGRAERGLCPPPCMSCTTASSGIECVFLGTGSRGSHEWHWGCEQLWVLGLCRADRCKWSSSPAHPRRTNATAEAPHSTELGTSPKCHSRLSVPNYAPLLIMSCARRARAVPPSACAFQALIEPRMALGMWALWGLRGARGVLPQAGRTGLLLHLPFMPVGSARQAPAASSSSGGYPRFCFCRSPLQGYVTTGDAALYLCSLLAHPQ
jgi:hypothetical protein